MKGNLSITDLQEKGFVEASPGKWVKAKTQTEAPTKKKHKYNAEKVMKNGEVYDSKRERMFGDMLDLRKIKYDRQVPVVLQEGFVYENKKIRDIKMVLDYGIRNKRNVLIVYVDVKGMVLPDWKLKKKMLQYRHRFNQIPIYTPSNKTQCLEVCDIIETILQKS